MPAPQLTSEETDILLSLAAPVPSESRSFFLAVVLEQLTAAGERGPGALWRIGRDTVLRDALMAVAGRKGNIDARALGNWLSGKADRVIIGRDNTGLCAFENAGEKHSVALWRLASRHAISPAAQDNSLGG